MSDKFNFQTLPKNPDLAESFDVFLCNEYSLPSFAIRFLKTEYDSYEARSDDIYVISHPKTGTTWLKQMVYLIHSGLDFQSAANVSLHQRFPYIEHASTDFNAVKTMDSPRLLNSHLPYSCLPRDILDKKCKILYITRNPRDVAVSYYHFACMLKETQYKGSFEQFFERFISGRATYGPLLEHNLEFWNQRSKENILFLFYEDLKMDFDSNIKKIAEFLNKPLSDKEIKEVINHCDFKTMSKNETVGLSQKDVTDGKEANFFRKGEIGDWKNYFSNEMITRMDEAVCNVLKDSGLSYKYEV